MPLLQPRADFDVFVEASEDGAALGADGGGDDHAIGFDATKFARGKIDNHGDFAADERFRLVVLRDARANLPNFRADIHRELEKPIRARSDRYYLVDMAGRLVIITETEPIKQFDPQGVRDTVLTYQATK